MSDAIAPILDSVSKLSDEDKGELVIKVIGNLSVLSLSKLVKSFEDTFGVKAAAGGGMMMAMPGAAAPAAPAEEAAAVKDKFDVILKGAGDKKIQVIKEVRAITGLGLKEAKDLVDKAPQPVKEGISKEDSEKYKKQLEEAGGQVEIK